MVPRFEAITVQINGVVRDARLVFCGSSNVLLAVLLYLSALHGDDQSHNGYWFLEAGIGDYAAQDQIFRTLEDAARWFGSRNTA